MPLTFCSTFNDLKHTSHFKTEQNIFAQLLLYRIAPLWSWKFHLASAVFYVLTRLFITITFLYVWIEWAMSDEIKNEFNGSSQAHAPYIGFFFFMPIANILLNVAQFQTIKALFYVSMSVRDRVKERNRFVKYPKMQELYDMFIEYDSDDDGCWTLSDFKKFIYYNNQTFIQRDTCIILWNCLGFVSKDNIIKSDNDVDSDDNRNGGDTQIDANAEKDAEAENDEVVVHLTTMTSDDLQNVDVSKINMKKKSNMRWKDFRKIFGEHLKSDKFIDHSVKQIVSAQLQVLIATIFNAQSEFEQSADIDAKDRAMLKLYSDVNQLIKKKKKDDTEMKTKEIEMYIKTDDNKNSRELRKVVSMAILDDKTISKQLLLDDTIRNNLQRPSSIMHISPTSSVLNKDENV